MQAKLYSLSVSNPGHTARLMLEFKGIETKVVDLLPGMHPVLLWSMGYRRGTVPAMKLDGKKTEGSLEIAQVLEAAVPEPSLYPADADRRRVVEEAERWGESVLQNVPRRIFRWVLAHDNSARARIVSDIGLPLPKLVAATNLPIARAMASRVDADEAHVRSTLVNLRDTLDHVDKLIAEGVIGDPDRPNAADFQIAPSIRLIGALEDLKPIVAGRPCDTLARRLIPEFPEAPSMLPPELLAVAGL